MPQRQARPTAAQNPIAVARRCHGANPATERRARQPLLAKRLQTVRAAAASIACVPDAHRAVLGTAVDATGARHAGHTVHVVTVAGEFAQNRAVRVHVERVDDVVAAAGVERAAGGVQPEGVHFARLMGDRRGGGEFCRPGGRGGDVTGNIAGIVCGCDAMSAHCCQCADEEVILVEGETVDR